MRAHAVPIEEIAIVVPANDEEELLPACLDALSLSTIASSRLESTRVRLIVVLDDCRDRSAEIAAGYDRVETIEVGCRNVGAARHAGAAFAIGSTRASHPGTLWLANTDADSAVPPEWIDSHLEHGRRGAELLIGHVYPDPLELSADQLEAWERQHCANESGLRVYGANLGVRADTYLAAGGFPPYPEHEDVLLVDRIVRAGTAAVCSDASPVRTSARTAGRTPGGFAAYIRDNVV